ncbi:MAG: sigma-70 family RNA polymerase sigma factor [Minicystis sp.]
MSAHLRLLPRPDAPSGGSLEQTGEASNKPAPPPLTHLQQLLIKHGMPSVEPTAVEVARRYRGRLSAEELLGPGTMGLIEAARIYDQERHPDFVYFAHHYVLGRMIDAIRSERCSLRARVELALERGFSRHATDHVLHLDFLESEESQLEKGRQGADDAMAAAFVALCADAQTTSPEEQIVDALALRSAVEKLVPEEREVIGLVYDEGLTMDEVGVRAQVHANTAQRRHVSALRKLRALLVGEGERGR